MTEARPAPDLVSQFEKVVDEFPDHIAIESGRRSLTYRELDGRANYLAGQLVKSGVVSGDLVIVWAERSMEGIIGLLGTVKAGAAYVFVDPRDPPAYVDHIVRDTAARAVLVQENNRGGPWPEGVNVVPLEGIAEGMIGGASVAMHSDRLATHPGPDALAYVMYTSGSTGKPKGVMIEHGHIVDRIAGAPHLMPAAGEGMLQTSRLDFDAQTQEVWSAFLSGARLVVTPPGDPDPDRIAALMDTREIGVTWLSPGLFRQLVETHLKELGIPRLVMVGGDVLSPAHAQRFLETHPDRTLVNIYGPTEVTSFCLSHQVQPGSDHTAIPIGRPTGTNTAYVLDERGVPVPDGEPGELFIGGDCVGRGYLNRPHETDERFVPDHFAGHGARMYRSGDRVQIDGDGDLLFLGRSDDQVKVRGYRIELSEVGAAVRSARGVVEAVVIPREDLHGHRRLVAYVVFDRSQGADVEHLRAHIADRLPGHMMPSAFVALPDLPHTPRGKVDRAALPRPSDAAPVRERRAPDTPTERSLTEIWQRILHVAEIGVDDSFLELGGDSLLAVRVVVAVRHELGVELALRDVFDQETVARLAAHVDAASVTEEAHATLPALRHEARRRSVAATLTQAQACLISELAEEALPYQFQARIAFRGRLDEQLLANSLHAIVGRHEILRTRFVRRRGSWLQLVQPRADIPLPVLDLRAAPDPVTTLDTVSSEFFAQRIGIDEAPLIRWKLITLADDHHVLLHLEHHLVHDGWSWSIFLRELAWNYRARAIGASELLPPLEVQFGDFAAWQEQVGRSPAGQAQRSYWVRQLAELPPPLALASDRPRPARSSFRGSRLVVDVPNALVDQLRSFSSEHGVTLFMTMLSAFYAFLRQFSGQDDLVVGSGVANRRFAALEGLIGMLLNTVALRIDLKDDPSVDQLVQRVRRATLEAFSNQDLPFEEVLRAVQPVRHSATSPIYQVLFSFQDPLWGDVDFPGLAVELDDTVDNGSAKADLNVIVQRRRTDSDALSIIWEYSTDLFEPESARSMLDAYLALLAAFVADPTSPLSRLSGASQSQRDALLELAGHPTPYERDSSLVDLFEAQVRESPDATALAWDGGSLSYDELNRKANRLARRLMSMGAGSGGRVVVSSERAAATVIALLATLKVGSAYVVLDLSQSEVRLRALLEDAAPTVVCVSSRMMSSLPPTQAPVVLSDDGSLDLLPEEDLCDQVASDAPAYVAYTSGTTGSPKGVVVPHRAVVRLVRGTDYASFDRGETFLLHAPLAFDASTFEVWGPLLNGARLAIAPDAPHGPSEIAGVVERLGVTTLWLTSGLFHQVVDHAPGALGGLHQLLAGGDILSPDHVNRALAALPDGAVLVNGYGPTEGTTFTCCHRMAAGTIVTGSIPIGRPIPNTRVHIVDERGQLVPWGVPGELMIGGDGIALGYLGDPTLTATRFAGDPFTSQAGARVYQSGDRGRWRADGTIEFLGRLDRQVKVRGFRVELEAIERTLLNHPRVASAVVVAREEDQDRRIAAYVTPRIDAASVEELRDFLRRSLPAPEVPSFILSLDALPLSPNGKVDQAALPEPSIGLSGERGLTGPVDALERQLLGIWGAVLDVPGLGADDDFFDVGGHSLLAVDLFIRIEREIGLRLPLSTIFAASTVRQMAVLLRSNGWDIPWRSLAGLRTTGSRPPLFFVTAGDGNSVGFGALARRLGPDQPFFALQPRGLDGRRLVDVEVTRMARRYVHALRGVQQSGPYILGGRCFGTLVAFEMTRLLEKAGEEVSLLIALDSVGPLWTPRTMANGMSFDEVMNLARCYEPASPSAQGDIFASTRAADEFVEWLGEPVDVRGEFAVSRYVHAAFRARPDLQAAYPLAAGRHAELLGWTWVGGRSEMGMNPQLLPPPSPAFIGIPPSTDPRHRTRRQRIRGRATDWLDVITQGRVPRLAQRRQGRLMELASRMVLEYRAGPCAAPVALVRSEEYRDDAQLARWYGAETGGIEEFYVKGSHLTMMREPDVTSMARCVEACIDRVIADRVQPSR